MAQEFKQWDKAFTSKQILECRQVWLKNGASIGDILASDRWTEIVTQWSQQNIQNAVYSSEDWQLFRVSMKGLTTYEKMYMLKNRWARYCYKPLPDERQNALLEQIRIDNYLGALRRGGQLNGNYEVVK